MASESVVVRAAVVQAAPVAFDRERTLDKVAALTTEAAAKGAQIVVIPEAFLGLPAQPELRRGRGRPHARWP